VRAEIGGGLLLERGDIRPEHELAVLEDRVERLADPGQERRVLRLDVDEWDLHGQAAV
jgi:hypothetical protein